MADKPKANNNIIVAVRVRPLSKKESDRGSWNCLVVQVPHTRPQASRRRAYQRA